MTGFKAAGVMPNLNVMILFDDHTAGYVPGAKSPEDYVAENDHALGEIVGDLPFRSGPDDRDERATVLRQDPRDRGLRGRDIHLSAQLLTTGLTSGDVIGNAEQIGRGQLAPAVLIDLALGQMVRHAVTVISCM